MKKIFLILIITASLFGTEMEKCDPKPIWENQGLYGTDDISLFSALIRAYNGCMDRNVQRETNEILKNKKD
jgi:hypothetical protein